MLADKIKAREHAWRIPEAVLFILAFFGGSLGIFLGMQLFRHKTRKPGFAVGIPALLLSQGFLLWLLWP